MKTMNYYYSDKLGQFKEFSRRLNKMIDNGSFNSLSSEKRNMLIGRLRRLFNQLLDYMPELKLKHILAAAAIFVLSLKTISSNAQTFGAMQTNPFGLATVDTLARPAFVDIDGDSDFDAFVGDENGDLIYFQNLGTSTSPAFTTPQANPFGLANVDYAAPTFVDIDGDGDFDAFVGEYYGNIKYFQNTGTNTAPAFAAQQTNPFGLANVGYILAAPTFVDIDGDGDFDAFVGEYYGALKYFQNTGTNTAPAFAAQQTNPFGLASVGYNAAPSFVDIDGDGDFDLFVGEYYGAIKYFPNTGSNTAPAFAAQQNNPFGLADVGSLSAPAFVDIDGDGDKDLFVGEYYGAIKYFQNTSPTGIKENAKAANVTIYPNPAKDKFIVQFNGINGSGSVTLEVTNSIGQIILKEKAAVSENGYSFEINTAAFEKGLYYVKLTTKDNVIVRKLVVE
ncbi:MAG: T9SS type A sorting domain-containing protein [Cytophagales bacterium]|nr:T9SS type A sorting domain-containing protein [Cytophagales bacterium]